LIILHLLPILGTQWGQNIRGLVSGVLKHNYSSVINNKTVFSGSIKTLFGEEYYEQIVRVILRDYVLYLAEKWC
jgi:hypothetical protein